MLEGNPVKRIVVLGLALCVALLTETAHAHSGHAIQIAESNSGWHYALQPTHGGLVLALVLAIAGFFVISQIKRARLLRSLKAKRVESRHR